jgi:hypothetical protein
LRHALSTLLCSRETAGAAFDLSPSYTEADS